MKPVASGSLRGRPAAEVSMKPVQARPLSDDCINNSAPNYFDVRVYYNGDGEFSPDLVEEDVNSSSATSTVSLEPSTATHYSASTLNISPSTGASKSDLGDGQIVVTFTHPSSNCAQNTWQLSFGGGLTTTLTVKIRKTRYSPNGDE
jgi:hypothetical protein